MTEAVSAGPACRAVWALHSASAADLRLFEDARPGAELSADRSLFPLVEPRRSDPLTALGTCESYQTCGRDRRQFVPRVAISHLVQASDRPGRAEGTLH